MSALIHWLASSQDYFLHLGLWGILLFAALDVVVQMGMMPLSPLAVAAGAIFGFWHGLLAMEIGTAIGLALNFLIARYVARGPITRLLARNDKFRLIDQAIGREGGKIVFMLRLCPLPFGLSNFCYGLTAVRFWPYFFASVAGIIPGNFFFTWVGASANAGLQDTLGASHKQHHPFEYVMMGVGLVSAFFVLSYVARLAKAAVAEANATPTSTENLVPTIDPPIE